MDPVGRYVASIGDDHVLRVWGAAAVARDVGGPAPAPEAGVSSPFKRSAQAAVVRLDWSPDGEFLVASNAIDRRRHVAAVLGRRREWAVCATFVGHEAAVVAVRFAPALYAPTGAGGDPGARRAAHFSVCAVGSLDATLSIWATHSVTPLAVVGDGLFGAGVTDVAWHPSRPSLLAVSLDGSLACVELEERELAAGGASALTARERDSVLRDT